MSVDDIIAGQQVPQLRSDAEVLDGGASVPGDAERAADGDAHPGAVGQFFVTGVRKNVVDEVAVLPDVRASGARVAVGAEDRSNAVILKAGGENVRRAVAERIGDQHDRSEVALADRIALLGIGYRESG